MDYIGKWIRTLAVAGMIAQPIAAQEYGAGTYVTREGTCIVSHTRYQNVKCTTLEGDMSITRASVNGKLASIERRKPDGTATYFMVLPPEFYDSLPDATGYIKGNGNEYTKEADKLKAVIDRTITEGNKRNLPVTVPNNKKVV